MYLRDYQQKSIDATRKALIEHDRALIVAGCGAGKSVILSEFIFLAANKNKRVLQLVHTKELVYQNSQTFAKMCDMRNTDIPFSICCAGLQSKDTSNNVVFASPQTFVNNMNGLDQFDLIIIDEADKVPLHTNAVYQKILDRFKCKVVGMTATPYRDNNSIIYGTKDSLFDVCSYRITAKYLTEQGYLTPYKAIVDDIVHIDTDAIKIKSNGSYDEQSHADAFENFYIETVNDTLRKTVNSVKTMIFCVNIKHAEMVSKLINTEYVIHSKMSEKQRDQMIFDFKNDYAIKYIINVGILTIGFNCPEVDCIVLMRAIQSAPLYLQIIGRAQRTAKNKKHFTVIDFGNNIASFGGVYDEDVFNNITPTALRQKEKNNDIINKKDSESSGDFKCKSCDNVVLQSDLQCIYCGALTKNNLSFVSYVPDVYEEKILYTSYKFTTSKKGEDMCIISFKTATNSVSQFITLSKSNNYKRKIDRDFLNKYFSFKYSNLGQLRERYLDHKRYTNIKYFKNISGFFEIIILD